MSEGDIQVILHRLDEIGKELAEIHAKVTKTNGRVSDLELENARWQGIAEGRGIYKTVGASVLSGGMLAGIIWFVSTAI